MLCPVAQKYLLHCATVTCMQSHVDIRDARHLYLDTSIVGMQTAQLDILYANCSTLHFICFGSVLDVCIGVLHL